jgi:hypothetical protein
MYECTTKMAVVPNSSSGATGIGLQLLEAFLGTVLCLASLATQLIADDFIVRMLS